jgi:hypothetical protein
MAPPEHRDEATASVVEGFRDACIEYGIPIEPGDLAYYVTVVAAKVAEKLKPRLSLRFGELGLKVRCGVDAISRLDDKASSRINRQTLNNDGRIANFHWDLSLLCLSDRTSNSRGDEIDRHERGRRSCA